MRSDAHQVLERSKYADQCHHRSSEKQLECSAGPNWGAIAAHPDDVEAEVARVRGGAHSSPAENWTSRRGPRDPGLLFV
jgi:hypothetical protein